MFSLFKNTKRKEQQGQYLFDKAAAGIVKGCIHVQMRWAAYMQRKTARLSHKAKMYCLLLFCLLSVGCSLYLILESFAGTSKKNLGLAPINVPVHAAQSGEEDTRSFLLITKKEFERIEQFRLYLDSLGRSDTGMKIRDSLLSLRPGLMDSIRAVERLYQLQDSKK